MGIFYQQKNMNNKIDMTEFILDRMQIGKDCNGILIFLDKAQKITETYKILAI
jgi:hypothetical protein